MKIFGNDSALQVHREASKMAYTPLRALRSPLPAEPLLTLHGRMRIKAGPIKRGITQRCAKASKETPPATLDHQSSLGEAARFLRIFLLKPSTRLED